ncbi:MAG: prepilin-type N-terminal cleavage/methylation domain-containing protein [Gemmatimonadaceae bacterium]
MTRFSTRAPRAGFSVLELVVVIIIVAIIVAIVLPRFTAYRSSRSTAAMVTDLQNLANAQAAYWGSKNSYTADTTALKVTHSPGTTIQIMAADATGWSAHITRQGSPASCAVFYGSALPLPPATVKNVIGCTK